ncbi:MAG TPA: pepsin/retropepsin-like aspartic protease family protein [Bacteroidales bacterium]|nr:pepsin/retropepsin-like aspartic protease family protein [Bacteroidales bacterium]
MINIPFEIVKLDDDGVQIFTNSYLNNIPARMIIDTGASKSLISNEFIEKHFPNYTQNKILNTKGSGIGEKLKKSFKTTLPCISYKNHITENFEIIIIDFEHIHNVFEYLGLEKINGILGCDLLKLWELNIDYSQSNEYEFIQPDGLGCQLITTNCKIAGLNLRFLIDSGASRTVIDFHTFNNLPFKLKKTVNSTPIAGLNSSINNISEFTIDTFTLGEFTIKNQSFLTMSINTINEYYSKLGWPIIEGILGGDLLLKFHFTIDFKNNCLITPFNVN